MTDGRPLLDVLAELFPDSSKTTLRQMLQNDRVLVNGAAERNAKRMIATGDDISVGARKRSRLDPRLSIVFEDPDLVVIHKPVGLLTIASSTDRGDNVDSILGVYYSRPVHVVQRLDYDTSGVMVFARNGDMRDRLQELFAAHDLTRIYSAVVHGRLSPSRGMFRSLLAEDSSLRVRSVANSAEGKEAITHYTTVASNAKYSLVDVTLETGRRNQIRVHFAEAGHPVVGDPMYGIDDGNPIGRLALHARHLSFVHPRTGKLVSFDVQAPAEFARLVR